MGTGHESIIKVLRKGISRVVKLPSEVDSEPCGEIRFIDPFNVKKAAESICTLYCFSLYYALTT